MYVYTHIFDRVYVKNVEVFASGLYSDPQRCGGTGAFEIPRSENGQAASHKSATATGMFGLNVAGKAGLPAQPSSRRQTLRNNREVYQNAACSPSTSSALLSALLQK